MNETNIADVSDADGQGDDQAAEDLKVETEIMSKRIFLIQANLVICGLFVCDFAYLRLRIICEPIF